MEKKNKVNKKHIEKVIGGMVDAIEKQADEENQKSPVYKILSEQSEFLKSPNEFYTMAIYPIRSVIDTFISKNIPFKKDNYLAQAIYTNYWFFENNLSNLCTKFYGSSCCVDKAKFLLHAAIEWKETGEMPIFDFNQDFIFHIPRTGTPEQWMNFVEALLHLINVGDSKKYLDAMGKLLGEHLIQERKDRDAHISKNYRGVGESLQKIGFSMVTPIKKKTETGKPGQN